MGKKDELNEERRKFEFGRIFGAAPWMKTIDKQRFKSKVFKSGNSLALRVPAGTKLIAGMEMELIVEDGQFLSFEPAEQPKRKFNIAKVAGSATDLTRIKSEDRVFDHRPLRGELHSDEHDG